MARVFFRLLSEQLRLSERQSPPSSEEVRTALEQLKDVGRFSIFASVSLIPGGAVSLIGLELLARSFDIDKFTLVPSSFRRDSQKDSSSCEQ